MEQEEMDERQLFEDIIRGQEMRDEGIVSHDEEMREFEAELRARYIERGFTSIPIAELEALEEKANERWLYQDEVATVTGRLEALSYEEDEALAALLGDIAQTDAQGEILHAVEGEDALRYLHVVDAKLRSGGVIIDVVQDGDDKMVDLRVGYRFYHLGDDDEWSPLFARPDSLDHHAYDTPTPTEARVRLERQWPQELEIIDAILMNGESLPHRLLLIEDVMREKLSDETFRTLVELHVNEEIHLDMKLPYILLVKQRIDVLGDVADDNSTWSSLDIEGSLPLSINAPDVRFTSITADDETLIETNIYGMAFNDSDGDKPEMVAVPVANIERFYSSRARGSLAERAIAAMDEQIEQDLQTIMERANVVKFAERPEQEDETPEAIRQLEVLEEAFRMAQRLGDEYHTHTFATVEDAKRDADVLLEKIHEHLNGTIFSRGMHAVEAMGERITKPNLLHDLEWDKERGIFIHGADPENPLVELPLGDKVVGSTGNLYSVARAVLATEESDEPAFYIPQVVMEVLLSQTMGRATAGEPALSQIIARKLAAVPIDETSDIRLSVLEQYRASEVAMYQARQTYGDASPLMGRIRQLDEALKGENPEDFTHLDPTLIARFGVDLGRAVRRHGHSVKPAEAVLETMFADRTILAMSNVYVRTAKGEYQRDTERSEVLNSWKVIDLKSEPNGEDVLVFVESQLDNEYRYLEMSSVTDFRF